MVSEIEEQLRLEDTLKTFRQLRADASANSKPTTIPGRNPFRAELDTASETRLKDRQLIRKIFGNRCECGAERAPITANAGQHYGKHSASMHLEHSIRNQPTFKHKHRSDRKTIVRDSMLRNIGKCVHQNLRRLQDGKVAGAPGPVPPGTLLKPSLSETNLTKCFGNEASDDMLDFRLVIAQCNELSLVPGGAGSVVGPSSFRQTDDEAPNYTHNSFRALRSTELTWHQLSRTTVNARHNRKRQLKKSNSTSSLDSDGSSVEVNFKGSGTRCGSSQGSGIAIDGDGLAMASLFPALPLAGAASGVGNTSLASSASSNAPSASSSAAASCSQQARLNAMPCDVTIDEMASYFETLVYIPKKMSSMAEMMYI